MTDLSGRIALVTGASRGIGRAAAVALARAGADVAVNYHRNTEAAAETVRRIEAAGRRAVPVQADVSRGAEVERLFAEVAAGLGPVDVLVNNAGQAKRQPFEDITEADWDEVLTVNLKSAFLVTKAALPHMRAQGWGRIVNVSSGAAKTGGSVGVHYTASKGGMDAMSRAFASRLVEEGVTVNIVSPTLIDTDMIPDKARAAAAIPMGRLGTVEECAEAIVFCAGEGYMTGQTILLNGGRYFG